MSKEKRSELPEPTQERLEPDPHALDVEAVKLNNDVSYYQRLLTEANDMVRQAYTKKHKVRAEVFYDMSTNGTKYGLPKDQPSATQVGEVIDSVPQVVEAIENYNYWCWVQDHYKGVLYDFQRKERCIQLLHSMWHDQYYAGPNNMPRELQDELQSHSLSRAEDLTKNVRQRGGE